MTIEDKYDSLIKAARNWGLAMSDGGIPPGGIIGGSGGKPGGSPVGGGIPNPIGGNWKWIKLKNCFFNTNK